MAVNRKKKAENRRKAPIELPRLAREANKYHARARKHWLGMAEDARKCGEALNQARYLRLWKRSKWKEWLAENFNGSYETAKVYCRIAKRWNDPLLEEARRNGMTLDSISAILMVLSGKKKPTGESAEEQLSLEECRRIEIRRMFAQKVKTELSRDDVAVLVEPYVFDRVWEKWYVTVRTAVCQVLERDPYEYEPKGSKFYTRFKEEEKRREEIRRRPARMKMPKRKTKKVKTAS